MKPFNLEQAKAGKPVCTRDGHDVRIICFDAKCDKYSIIALTNYGGKETVDSFTICGSFTYGTESSKDLFMKSESTYRPFKSPEEIMESIKEHGDWLVFHDPKGDYYHHISSVMPERKDLDEPLRVRFNGGTHRICQTDTAFYKFADGTPFGKLMEE